MISTRQLEGLPDIPGFIRVTRSLATLDAILSPEWEYRYYSFDSRWGQGEMLASMRNGSGDSWFALIGAAGVVLHGLCHEAPIYRPGSPPAGEFDTLPPVLRDAFLAEPAFETSESTFCIWRLAESSKWETGRCSFRMGRIPTGLVNCWVCWPGILRIISDLPQSTTSVLWHPKTWPASIDTSR